MFYKFNDPIRLFRRNHEKMNVSTRLTMIGTKVSENSEFGTSSGEQRIQFHSIVRINLRTKNKTR